MRILGIVQSCTQEPGILLTLCPRPVDRLSILNHSAPVVPRDKSNVDVICHRVVLSLPLPISTSLHPNANHRISWLICFIHDNSRRLTTRSMVPVAMVTRLDGSARLLYGRCRCTLCHMFLQMIYTRELTKHIENANKHCERFPPISWRHFSCVHVSRDNFVYATPRHAMDFNRPNHSLLIVGDFASRHLRNN